MSSMVQRVLVSGGGIGGLAVATALAQRGVSVEVIEARADFRVAGIGISVPNNALRMLNSLGVLEQCIAAGYVFDTYEMCDSSGESIVALPTPGSAGGVPGYMGISRSALSDILRSAATSAGVELSLGVTIEEHTEDPHSAHVRLTDGRNSDYDLVIGSEGLRSPMRARLFGHDADPVFTGYSCWRAKPTIGRRVCAMTKFRGTDTDAGLVPLNEHEMYLFHVTPEPGNPHLEPSEWRNLLVDRLEEYTGLIGEVRDNLPPAAEIIYSPLFEVHLPRPWHSGRAIVIGDAAHAVVPHLSQGGSQSLEDAVVLADELTRRPLHEALPAFMTRRFDRARRVQQASKTMLLREMASAPTPRDRRDEHGSQLSDEMKVIRSFLDQAV